jgi:hypothetical protein
MYPSCNGPRKISMCQPFLLLVKLLGHIYLCVRSRERLKVNEVWCWGLRFEQRAVDLLYRSESRVCILTQKTTTLGKVSCLRVEGTHIVLVNIVLILYIFLLCRLKINHVMEVRMCFYSWVC